MSQHGRQPEPPEDETLFGRIVVAKYLARKEHVEACLNVQAQEAAAGNQPRSLGEIMVQEGYITATQLETVLAEQKRRSGPKRFGDYEILSKVGSGGMGMVYRARHVSSGELVALKVVSKRVANDKSTRQRFTREANVGLKLDHPNIVATKDAGEVDGIPYLALELIEGGSLKDQLAKRNIFPELEALQMVQDIAMALDHANKKGFIHRDIKPENILFDSSFAVKLTDFGLVTYSEPGASNLTHTGITVGTPHYISPEQARAESDIDIRADIYSLGATLYRLLTGTTPFKGSSPLIVMTKHLGEQLQPPDELNPNLSEGCVALIEKMMAKERDDRYESPVALIRDIDRVIGGKLPEVAPLAAHKSSFARSVVRDGGTQRKRQSSSRVPAASKIRAHARFMGPSRTASHPAKALIPFAILLAAILAGWAVIARFGSPTPKRKAVQNSHQQPSVLQPTQTSPSPVRKYVWTGRQGDGLWSTAGNWNGNEVPGMEDTAVFDGPAKVRWVHNRYKGVGGIVLEKGFKGTLDLGVSPTTLGPGGLTQKGGTLNLGQGDFEVNGPLRILAGTFNPQRSHVRFNLPKTHPYDIEGTFELHAATFTSSRWGSSHNRATLTGTLTVNGPLMLDGYGVGGWQMSLDGTGEIRAKSEVIGNARYFSGEVKLTLCGKGDQNVKNLWWGSTGTYTVEKSSGKVIWEGSTQFMNTTLSTGGRVDATNSEVLFEGLGAEGGVRVKGRLSVPQLTLKRLPHTGNTQFDFTGTQITVTEKLILDLPSAGGWHAVFSSGNLVCKKNITCVKKGAWKGDGMLTFPNGARISFKDASAKLQEEPVNK